MGIPVLFGEPRAVVAVPPQPGDSRLRLFRCGNLASGGCGKWHRSETVSRAEKGWRAPGNPYPDSRVSRNSVWFRPQCDPEAGSAVV